MEVKFCFACYLIAVICKESGKPIHKLFDMSCFNILHKLIDHKGGTVTCRTV
ncbi:Uncharacterised protein [Segatella copri]|nr:Uncharacterised protein [Segatella copri]